ncbi:hypothetical protein A2631_03255 [Candidatus Daviesbacteria bacterium RIFCSPHIGHO2_01_FULL_44_29]|uniref:Transcription elongation factor GreA n=1 Tax=Candidatus Daviesbacteria bacterium RIFCSPHIGHO2_02_FULL_43_12 TaxID=1797776 RepID=A0A1F5KKW1_9BACT|nr:MAG: hypothetical protein A2631_03255 [Candidatus Daviesbacteria bacterium RIFCSPHIGHO2_01_FULL_44_29]OGE40312.1 MAG: hypothetical protein A3E86_03825 [Candidatus Daviesbacteria bacterium RIFCSPHIGHO2_12_FULL_47_45]OGE41435.1 MAG: hypothetical protein A3D25_02650 [Candidatus Daviesbacteria bacterium RIFCSPHIGHO2_02_FULL_43_12]OGE69635.1 MAG: hypothetical protein A3B55_04395 [Candidatus Daviesbacteria bacterium RIFCSPLOWO2_01_FULL_43_15]
MSLKQAVFLTPAGVSRIKEELAFLKQVKSREVAQRIAFAREMGGLEENVEFDAAVEEQGLVEARIVSLEQMLKHVKLIKHEHKETSVTMGSTVSLKLSGVKQKYTIVGKFEANPAKKMISNESPIGLALLGAHIGDDIEVKTPASSYQCRILEID